MASLAGEPCRLRHGMTGPVTVRAGCGRDPAWRDVGNGTIEIDLRRGDEVVVFPAGTRPDLVIAPVRVTVPAPPWGLPPLPWPLMSRRSPLITSCGVTSTAILDSPCAKIWSNDALIVSVRT